MMKLYVFLLGVSALVISTVGATFSITGLAKLFAGAPMAVMFMAGALEFAKLVAASFMHSAWPQLPRLLKIYLTTAVVILVCITSMGIFGYLTHAYQTTAVALKHTDVKINSLEEEEKKVQGELSRLEAALNAIPVNRISKRIELQKELEPQFQHLKKQSLDINIKLRELHIQRLSYQTEIGPILYVAQSFGSDTDNVARWLILLFVIVFDPLAVCLVLATSFAIKLAQKEAAEKRAQQALVVEPVASSVSSSAPASAPVLAVVKADAQPDSSVPSSKEDRSSATG